MDEESINLTKKIGQRLRAARNAHGYSLAELAARTNSLSKSRISNYEQGIRRMGLEEAAELSNALDGLTPTYLLCLDERSPLTKTEWKMIEAFRNSDERGKDTILRVCEVQREYSVPAMRSRLEMAE